MKRYIILILTFLISTYFLSAQDVGLDFDGVNDAVISTVPAITGNNARTIEAWIKTTKDSRPPSQSGQGQSVIVDMGSFVIGGRFTFNLLWNNAIRLEVGGNGLSGTIPVNDGQWHHVAVSYNPSLSPNFYLYVDGILDVAGNVTVPVNIGSVNNIQLGKRIDDVNFFEGAMDEVRVYNYAKDSLSIYNEMDTSFCSPQAGMVAYFKLNDGMPGVNNTANLTFEEVNMSNASLINFALSGNTSNWVVGAGLSDASNSATVQVEECDSFVSPSGNYTWTQTGMYTDTFTNAAGCDSVVTFDLTINNSSTTQIDSSACGSLAINGQNFFSDTSFTETLMTSSMCDSLVTYNLTVYPIYSTQESISACDSIEINGTWYTTSQQITDFNTSVNGCDSAHVIDLIINLSQSTQETIQACDSIEIDGTWYFTDTQIVVNDVSVNGCDSVHTIDLGVEVIDPTISFVNDYEIIVENVVNATYSFFDCNDSTIYQIDTLNVFNCLDYFLLDNYINVVIESNNCVYTFPVCFLCWIESINNINQLNLNLSPNPNTGSFVIANPENLSINTIQIFDLNGKEVYVNNSTSRNDVKFDLNLDKGLYILVLKHNGLQYQHKFSVK